MNRQDAKKRLADALERLETAGARLVVDMSVRQTLAIIQLTQLAMRHPEVGDSSTVPRQEVVDYLIHVLESREPAMALLRHGNRPGLRGHGR